MFAASFLSLAFEFVATALCIALGIVGAVLIPRHHAFDRSRPVLSIDDLNRRWVIVAILSMSLFVTTARMTARQIMESSTRPHLPIPANQ